MHVCDGASDVGALAVMASPRRPRLASNCQLMSSSLPATAHRVARRSTLQMGTQEGPYNSHQVVLSLAYDKDKNETVCLHGPITVWDSIQEAGIYNPGHGWVVIKDGKNVISSDGKAKYQWYLRHHPSYVNVIKPNYTISIARNKALTYGVAAGLFGISIQATTQHSTSVAQSYKAGSSRARFHYVWGNDGSFTSDPKVVYSY